MAIQTINIGNVVNDGLGDDLRTAFQKVNANFATLDSSLTVTASNTTGTAGYGVFKEKVGNDLKFKTLVPGTKLLIQETTDALVINNTQPFAFTRIDTNAGFVQATEGNIGNITLQGSDNIDVTAFGDVITVDTILPITSILSTYDFGPINGEYENTVQFAISQSNIEFGTITLSSRTSLDCGGII